MEGVIVDTTVQTKAVAYPTDGHLMLRAIERLGPKPPPRNQPRRPTPSSRTTKYKAALATAHRGGLQLFEVLPLEIMDAEPLRARMVPCSRCS
jgi:hypothetical protein